MYVHIVSTCEFSDGEYLDAKVRGILKNDYTDAIAYLAQWDAGRDSEFLSALTLDIERCRGDRRYDDGEYVLIEHPLYLSLYRKL